MNPYSFTNRVSRLKASRELAGGKIKRLPEPPPVPTYSIVPDLTLVDESSTINFAINTTNVADGITLYWIVQSLQGSVNNLDFVDSSSNGSVQVLSNTATFSKVLSADSTTEGQEVFRVLLKTNSFSGPTVAVSPNITISDTSVAIPTYSIAPLDLFIDEGTSVVFNVTTTNVNDGTTLYWTTSGSVDGLDFIDNQLSGTTVVVSNSSTILRSISSDNKTEGPENFLLQLRLGSFTNPVVATSIPVTINDTSIAIPTYSIVSSVLLSADEASSAIFNITTTNVDDGTTLYWTTSGSVDKTDFIDNQLSGTSIVTSNNTTITRAISADNKTEGPENFLLQIRTGSFTGPIVATSNPIRINDTSIEYLRTFAFPPWLNIEFYDANALSISQFPAWANIEFYDSNVIEFVQSPPWNNWEFTNATMVESIAFPPWNNWELASSNQP